MTTHVISVEKCKHFCSNKDESLYVALIKAGDCQCIYRADQAVVLSDCKFKCRDGKDCGGNDVYSVYVDNSTKASFHRLCSAYIGQYYTVPTILDTLTFWDENTWEGCAHFCQEKNHSVFMLLKTRQGLEYRMGRSSYLDCTLDNSNPFIDCLKKCQAGKKGNDCRELGWYLF
ncbi:hypothetical protein HELRODRAFT_177773 [Helobdella robusta]|uniref:WSC domain-containing protein n=1 Tax=Helobdella robusta TaxID=6412 RepID=T1FC86_HELRO|nr:hypothetical protein HELRODRAFT_177773 [Helobdella robusta]ESN97714.1 hypothetical protein HELRODRAFT_177773 [Helobdella robusta]